LRRKTELSEKTTVTRESFPVLIKSPTLIVHPTSATGFQFDPSHNSTVVPEKSEIYQSKLLFTDPHFHFPLSSTPTQTLLIGLVQSLS